MEGRQRIHLTDETLKEITQRATSDELAQSWAQYLMLIKAASSILGQAPQSATECASLDIVERVGDDLESVTTLIHQIFPGGLKEAWHYYLPERMREIPS